MNITAGTEVLSKLIIAAGTSPHNYLDIKNFCLFCWLEPLERAWEIYNAFIDYNFWLGGLHRLGAMWIVIHIWTDIIVVIIMINWLWKRRKQ